MRAITLLVLFILSCYSLAAQDNLVINPGFTADQTGWMASVGSELSRVNEGALSTGAALLQVSTVTTGISGRQMSSQITPIPAERRGEAQLFAVYARADAGQEFRVSIQLTNAAGDTRTENTDIFLLTSSFERYDLDLEFAANDVSFRIRLQCGNAIGSYYFDDFRLLSTHLAPQNIAQFDHWEERTFTIPTNSESYPLSNQAPSAVLQLFPDEVIAPVLSTQFGVNSNFRSSPSLLDRIPLYERFGSFRFPAGSGSNRYFWDCNAPENFAIEVNDICGTAGNNLSPEQFISFKEGANGEPTVVVNYFYARYGLTPNNTRTERVQQAADYAAALVNYLNVELQAGIRYWEIGNECYGSWEEGYEVNGSIVTGQEYGEDFRVFAETMKAVDPNIWVGAVLWHKEERNWNEQVLREVEDHADFLIVHQYFNVEDAESASEALEQIGSNMQEIQQAVALNTTKPAGHFPVAYTEFNIQEEPATTLINGMFMAEALAQVVASRYTMSNVWVNEWNIDGFHSKGLLAINDPDQADYTPRPSYLPYHYYDQYFGDRMIKTELTGNPEIRAYASSFSSGETGIVVVNYSATEQYLAVDSPEDYQTAYWHSVCADNVEAGNKKFYINGYTGPTVGGGPEDFMSVPARRAIFNTHQSILLPSYSVNFLTFSNETVNTEEVAKQHNWILAPNPSSGRIEIRNLPSRSSNWRMYDIAGREVFPAVLNHDDNSLLLDGSRLSNGIYFILIDGAAKKIILNKS